MGDRFFSLTPDGGAVSVGGVVEQLQDPTSALGALTTLLPEDSPIHDILAGYDTLESALGAANEAGVFLPDSLANYDTLAPFTQTGHYANMLLGGGTGLTTSGVGSQAWMLAEQTAEFGLEGVQMTIDALGGAGMMSALMTAGFGFVGMKILGDILTDQFGPDNDYADVGEDAAMASGQPLEQTLIPMMQGGYKMLNTSGEMTEMERIEAYNQYSAQTPIMFDLFNNFNNQDLMNHPLGPMAAGYLTDSMTLLQTGLNPPADAHDLKNALWITGGDYALAAGIAELVGHASGERMMREMLGKDPEGGHYVTSLNDAIEKWKVASGEYMGGMPTSVNGFWTPIIEAGREVGTIKAGYSNTGTFHTGVDFSGFDAKASDGMFGLESTLGWTSYEDDPEWNYSDDWGWERTDMSDNYYS